MGEPRSDYGLEEPEEKQGQNRRQECTKWCAESVLIRVPGGPEALYSSLTYGGR